MSYQFSENPNLVIKLPEEIFVGTAEAGYQDWLAHGNTPIPAKLELMKPDWRQMAEDSLLAPEALREDWQGLYSDLESSSLLTRIVFDSIQFPQVSTPLNLLITLITSTRSGGNLQARLNLVADVLSSLGKGLTSAEKDWLNSRLAVRAFTARAT